MCTLGGRAGLNEIPFTVLIFGPPDSDKGETRRISMASIDGPCVCVNRVCQACVRVQRFCEIGNPQHPVTLLVLKEVLTCLRFLFLLLSAVLAES
jgi:hypothetical protein